MHGNHGHDILFQFLENILFQWMTFENGSVKYENHDFSSFIWNHGWNILPTQVIFHKTTQRLPVFTWNPTVYPDPSSSTLNYASSNSVLKDKQKSNRIIKQVN